MKLGTIDFAAAVKLAPEFATRVQAQVDADELVSITDWDAQETAVASLKKGQTLLIWNKTGYKKGHFAIVKVTKKSPGFDGATAIRVGDDKQTWNETDSLNFVNLTK